MNTKLDQYRELETRAVKAGDWEEARYWAFKVWLTENRPPDPALFYFEGTTPPV